MLISSDKPTIIIGIPAFNEEDNLGKLLRGLKMQRVKKGQITKVIVASDGSIDKTVDIVKTFKYSKVILIEGKKRRGKAYRQNQIIKLCNSDILVLLDADTLLD